MTAEDRLQETLQSIDEQIMQIARRPLMYVGGEEHLHAAEVMVRLLLHIWDNAMGYEGIDRGVERKYLHERYPEVPGPVRSVATGCKRNELDFTTELLRYVAWYKEQSVSASHKGSTVGSMGA